jgi:branched-chain amino acid transport system permease protein
MPDQISGESSSGRAKLPPSRASWSNRASALPFVLFLIGYFLVPRFAGDKYLTTLIYIGINVLLALGLNLLMGYAGQVSLGHAAFFGMGAYTSAILTVRPVPETSIPSLAVGIGVMAGTAVILSLARPSGGRLVTGVIGLIAAALIVGKLNASLPVAIAVFTALMALIGVVAGAVWRRGGWAGWWHYALAGPVAPLVIWLTSWFLKGTLARGGTSPWTGMAVGIAITGLVAYLIGGQVLRLKGNYLAMATLAFGIIIEIVFRQWTDVFGGSSDGIFGIPSINVMASVPKFAQKIMHLAVGGPVDERTQYYFLVWGFVFLALVIASNIVRSRVGRAFRAVHGSEMAAESLGVDTERYKVQVFVFSAALASVAGSLYAHNAGIGYINPTEFDFMTSVQLVVMVVVGGMASVWGALFGAGMIQFLKDWMMTLERGNPQVLGVTLKGLDPIVFGAVLIVVMVILPTGLVRGVTDGVAGLLRMARRAGARTE